MINRASEGVGRLKVGWGRMKPAQRWLATGLVAALLLATGAGVYLNRPEWVVLVSQADPKDAAEIVARLQELKVPYQPVGDGYTITVPKEEQYTAKLALAQSGIPRGGSVGMELFDEPKFGATDFERRVNYLRAQQGELERALTRISEVEYANVKLAIPERSVFLREQQPVTAAVMLQLRAGRKLSNEQVTGVINFISGSVEGLAVENVSVVDQSGRLLSAGLGTDGTGNAGDTDFLQRQMTLQRDMEHRVQTLLEPIFGAGNVIARVNLELNTESSKIEKQTVGGATPKSTEVVKEIVQGGTTTGAGAIAPGTGDTAPTYVGQGGTTTTGDQWKTTTTTVNEISQQKETTLVAPGGVKRISVGIVINRPDLTPEQIKQIQDTVSGATGASAYEISVANMGFNRADAAADEEEAAAATGLSTSPLWIGGGLAAVLLLVGLFMTRRRRRAEQEAEDEALPDLRAEAPIGTTLDVALGSIDPARTPATVAAEAPPAEAPAETGATGGAIEQLTKAMSAKPKRALIVEGQPVDPELLGQAEELIDTSPEAGAAILKQWLRGGM
ncbi:MAG TPA: flagellar basal-body MS-ring/collar protein FliF [Symbiobacteriaceae bacterium]|nr:flagellar basal-body MS-ring/collar protein FliF [Symbiobacteriaceae bacterium]